MTRLLPRVTRFLPLAALVALAACAADTSIQPDRAVSGPGASLVASQAPELVEAGEVIVRLQNAGDANAVAAAHGMAVVNVIANGRAHVMRGAAGNEHALARAVGADARVVYAEPNYLRQPTVDPRLWAFYNPGGLNMFYTRGKTAGQSIGASYTSIVDADQDNVEGYAIGGAAVIVGSIDTGVELTHPEFRNADGTNRLIQGRDWYNNDAVPADEDGHGTHTTGTMIGNTVGVSGVSGAGPNVRAFVQRVCGQRGCPTAAIVSAIYAAADVPGLVAMNLSLGGTSESQAEKDAIAYATSKGVLVIASAGNDGTNKVSCPACDANAISVSATTWSDGLASYSNYGPGLDIAAPGGECFSNTTAEGCIYSAYKGGGYAWLQGTSMAAPQVTGTAGIVASMTGLRGAALKARLLSTADAKPDQSRFGAGRLNSYRAVVGTSLTSGQ